MTMGTAITEVLYLTWQICYPICLGIINFCVVIGIWMWLSHPRYLFLIFRRFNVWRSGLKLRHVVLDETRYQFAERGVPDQSRLSTLFIHGFSTDLTSWCGLLEGLPAEDHVIAIDLPGHGGSWIAAEEDFDYEPMARKIKQIIDAVGLSKQPLHVVGQSMGGSIAGLLAAFYPEQVELVTMVCPAINGGTLNEFRRRLLNGDASWTVPTTKDEVKIMFRRLCYRPVQIPGPIIDGLLEERLRRYNFHISLLQHIVDDKCTGALIRRAPEIHQPSQLIWGNQDEIAPVEEIDTLRSGIPNLQRCDVIDECGHSIHLEQPEVLLKFLNLFRKNYELKKFK